MKNGYFIGNINPTFSDKPTWNLSLVRICDETQLYHQGAWTFQATNSGSLTRCFPTLGLPQRNPPMASTGRAESTHGSDITQDGQCRKHQTFILEDPGTSNPGTWTQEQPLKTRDVQQFHDLQFGELLLRTSSNLQPTPAWL